MYYIGSRWVDLLVVYMRADAMLEGDVEYNCTTSTDFKIMCSKHIFFWTPPHLFGTIQKHAKTQFS